MMESLLLNLSLWSQSGATTLEFQSPDFGLVGWLIFLSMVIGIWLLLQTHHRTWRQRVTLLAIRGCLVIVLLLMMLGWTRQDHETQRPELLLLIDHSASMQLEDEYTSKQLQTYLSETPGQSQRSFARWEIVNAWLRAARFDDHQQQWIPSMQDERNPLSRLSQDYRLSIYSIGDGLQAWDRAGDEVPDALVAEDFSHQQSLLGDGLRDAINQHRGRSIAAVILLSDGINTDGMMLSSASDLAARKSIPLFIGGMGSEQPSADIALLNPEGPAVAYLGEQLYFEVDLNLRGHFPPSELPTEIRMMASHGIDDDPFLQFVQTLSPAQKTHRIRIPFTPVTTGEVKVSLLAAKTDGEQNIKNNRVDFQIQVYDRPTKVLMIEDQPGFEYRALVDLFSRSTRQNQLGMRFELESVLFSADTQVTQVDPTLLPAFPPNREQLFQYDVIIVGNVGSHLLNDRYQQMLVDFVTQRGGGMVFTSGSQAVPAAFAGQPLETLFPVAAKQFQSIQQDSEAARIQLTALGQRFSHLQISADQENNVAMWESLVGPYQMVSSDLNRPGVYVLATATTLDRAPQPLITQQFIGAGKVIFHWFDATWRWNVLLDGQRSFDRYWEQTMRYLSRASLSGSEQLIELTVQADEFQAGDPVPISVRFLDERRAPADDQGVVLRIDHELGRRRMLRLSRQGASRGRFTGTISGLEPGTYRVELAEPVMDSESAAGSSVMTQFRVVTPRSELLRRDMDRQQLKQIAENTGGQYFAVSELHELVSEIPPGRQVYVRRKAALPVWNSNWVIAIVICLLSVEWCLRKRWYN